MKWILLTLLLFGSVDAFWVGGQWLLAVPATSRLSALESGIKAMQEEIEKTENALQPLAHTLHKYKKELSALKIEIESIKATYPDGNLPSRVYEDYLGKVDRYNLLAEESRPILITYETLYNDYMSRIARHNSLVEEGMNLAQKHNQIWVFAPKGRVFFP